MKHLLLALWLAPALFAQDLSHPVMASRDDASSQARLSAGSPDTVHVLAVRVQFQVDTDTRTTGSGRFDLAAGADSSLDAPPHDAQYFRDHLQFLANYFRKTSRGRLLVQPTLLDSVVTLPSPMAAYSPPKSGPNTSVATLARDTWRSVDSLGFVADFGRYDCFILFHAGAGRDIDLVGSLGYDPTPLDIPSLFFGRTAFRDAFGVEGIPVAGGSVLITNTIVLPETERRLLPGVTGDVQLLLSINGLLCASFGNYLGLPDLFDTRSGRSGIGRFGLMDGQAIFSFAGLFPPEPSAWEKTWLGWNEPITVSSGVISLPAVGFGTVDAGRADTIYRVPISGSEYYLLENRNRDPGQDGMRVTQSLRGSPRTLSVRRDTAGFEFSDVSRIVGVVTDVEDFDWSLPGWLDVDGTFYDGGILIWHIDESVIREGIATNGVNADPLRRGVDVVEADGSQDIGQQYDQYTAGSGSEEGTPLDFWYSGNSAPVYRNAFSPTTFPSTVSNNGGNSKITIKDFSPRGPRMTAIVSIGEGAVRPLPGYPKQAGELLGEAPLAVVSLAGGGAAVVMGTTGQTAPAVRGVGSLSEGRPKLFAWGPDGGALVSGGFTSGFLDTAAGSVAGGLSMADLDGDGVLEVVRGFSSPSGSRYRATSLSAGADSLGSVLLNVIRPAGPAAFSGVSDSLVTFAGGTLSLFTRGGAFVDSIALPGDSVVGVTQLPPPYSFLVAGKKGSLLLTSRGRRGTPPADISLQLGSPLIGPAAAAVMGSALVFAVTGTDGRLFLLDDRLATLAGFPIDLGEGGAASPVLADVDGDGFRDIIAVTAEHLHVINRIGVELDGFPVALTDSAASSPVVADLNEDGNPDVLVVTRRGAVVAIDGRGKMLTGYPLSAGRGEQWPAVFVSGDSVCLAVASSEDGSLSAWRVGRASALPWPQFQRDAARSGYDVMVLSLGPRRDEFFPESRAYNWPNPVYGMTTQIRYYVREDASVTIRIFDLAGDRVAEFSQDGVGGVDNEFVWDVSGVQSGIYFAHIQAQGAQGTGKAVIKIAVVK